MARRFDPTESQAPSQAPETSPSHIGSRLQRFPWWVFLIVGLCLCGSVGTFAVGSSQYGQLQATATARALATPAPTHFDPAPGFGVITNTPAPPYTATLSAILDATQTAQVVIARSMVLAATETALAMDAASLPSATPQIINPDYAANASVISDQPVTPNGTITVAGKLSKRGQAVQGAIMSVALSRQSQAAPTGGPRTNDGGIAVQTLDIGQLAPGVRVEVDIAFYVDGQLVARTSGSFTPHE